MAVRSVIGVLPLLSVVLVGCDGGTSPSAGDSESQAGGAGITRPEGGRADSEAGYPDANPSSVRLDFSGDAASNLLGERAEPAGLSAARARAQSLLAELSGPEKLSLVHGVDGAYVGNVPPAGPVPALTLQDGPAGVARLADITAFPSPITLAASWDRDLVRRWGAAMGAEQRGKGVMVMLGPMINLARVPAGGRNFEGFGEDPFLAAELVAADVEGIQSQKVVATAKHFVGNEQETHRTSEDSRIDERTLHELYDFPFEASVRAGVGAVMCSYNRINGPFACDDPVSLGRLKAQMGFTGWVMSDWGATHSTAAAANAGLDMEMPDGKYFGALEGAIADGSVPKERLDDMVGRVLVSLARVGVLDDPPQGNARAIVSSEDHTKLALEAATQGITLLRNEKSVLPWSESVRSIAVIGSAASDSPLAIGGGSAAVQVPYIVSPLDAIKARAGRNVAVTYARGDDGDAAEAASVAAEADAAVVFAAVESTEGEDRGTLALSPEVDALIEAVAAANPRTVVVLHVPGAVLMPWLDQVSSVVIGWFPGQENGNAIASVLFGDSNPSGRLPVTFPRDAGQLPSPDSSETIPYSEGLAIGYRWFDANKLDPLFAFGHGLSYSTFEYSDWSVSAEAAARAVDVSFVVRNTGAREGIETAQLYVGFPEDAVEPPLVLRGFERIRLAPGESQRVSLSIGAEALRCWDAVTHGPYVPSGTYEIAVGRSSRDLRLRSSIQVVGSDRN